MNFEMTGFLQPMKETEKFKPYIEQSYDSGWVSRRLKFNVICNTNKHVLSIDGGSFSDGHGDIYVIGKNTIDDNGKIIKGETFKIPFNERFTSKRVEEVAEFKKLIFDTEEYGRRYILKNLVEKLDNKENITDEELKSCDVNNVDDLKSVYNESLSKRYEFISEWDFVEFVKDVLNSGEFKDRPFTIKGEVRVSYNPESNKFYTSYVPNRIYLAKPDTEIDAVATGKVYFGSEAIDDSLIEETDKYYVDCYTFEYNKETKKKDLAVPIRLSIKSKTEKEKKIAKKLLGYFEVEDEAVKELGLRIRLIDGAEVKEIELEDLDEETRENVELGLITLEDIKREIGGVFGDNLKENQIIGLAQGYSRGSKETVYTPEDFIIKSHEKEVNIDEVLESDDDEI